MKFNKVIIISLLLLAIISFGSVSATDDLNSTDECNSFIAQLDSDVSDDLTIENKMVDSEIDDISQSVDDINNEILKDEKIPIVVNNETFNNYFDNEGKLLESVPEGSVLDFQGSIIASNNINAIYINKSVSIVSSTGDAVIMLNTSDFELGKENIAGRFVVDDVSGITIENIIFNSTQLLIYDSSNVFLRNISVLSDFNILSKPSDYNKRVCGFVRLYNLNNVVVENNFFNVSYYGCIIECNDIKNVSFDRNKFIGNTDKRAMSGIFYRDFVYSSVNVTNNYLNKTNVNILASNILFENNTLEQPKITNIANTITVQLGDSGYQVTGVIRSNIILRNNVIPGFSLCGNLTVINNSVKYKFSAEGLKLLMYNNSLGSNIGSNTVYDVSIPPNSICYNNIINGTLKAGSNTILKDSYVGGITFKGRNITVINCYIDATKSQYHHLISIGSIDTYFYDNTISGNIKIEEKGQCEIMDNIINGSITIASGSSIVSYNEIYAFNDDYAIIIIPSKDNVLNDVFNNRIFSRFYCGENAVSYDENYLNYIEDNTPSQIYMSVNIVADNFDYGKNTTLFINLPDVEGKVTIDVDGKKYIVELVGGSASQVLSDYNLGVNNVSIIYEDFSEDIAGVNFTTFTVKKVSYCPIELIYGDAEECRVVDVRVILPNDANGTITLTLSNEVYSVDIEQGANGAENIVTLPGLFEGDYVISATFTSVKYVTNSTTGNISFVHVPVYKLTANNVVMDYKDGSKYKVLVTKDGKPVSAGEVVKISFNGKTKSVKTDKNGYAVFMLDAAPKTYTIKSFYNGVTKSSQVIIKNVLKAVNVSKKKAKKIKFSASLKTIKGKAIVGKKVTFKVKGKTYSAKTNKKGVATVSIKNLKVGKYTITLKYGLCTLKKTLTVKK